MEKETVKVVRHTGDSLETKNEDTVGPEVSKRFRNSIASFAFAGTPNLRRSPRSLIPKGSPKSTLPCNDTPRRRKRSESKLATTVHDDETTMDSFEPELSNSSKSPASSKKVKRSYAPPEVYSHLGGLKDRLEENLDVLFCGINPGVRSAQVGFHYANPTNHFWRCLFLSGFTERLLQPREEAILPGTYNIGLTDLVHRPSCEQAELSPQEMSDSVPVLLTKIKEHRPRIVCFVGKYIWTIFEKRLLGMAQGQGSAPSRHSFDGQQVKTKPSNLREKGSSAKPDRNKSYGLQPYHIEHVEVGSHIEQVRHTLFFVVPSTSGRVVSHQLVDKVELFKQLRQHAQDHASGSMDFSTFRRVSC